VKMDHLEPQDRQVPRGRQVLQDKPNFINQLLQKILP
jgi:hypothetical protein